MPSVKPRVQVILNLDLYESLKNWQQSQEIKSQSQAVAEIIRLFLNVKREEKSRESNYPDTAEFYQLIDKRLLELGLLPKTDLDTNLDTLLDTLLDSKPNTLFLNKTDIIVPTENKIIAPNGLSLIKATKLAISRGFPESDDFIQTKKKFRKGFTKVNKIIYGIEAKYIQPTKGGVKGKWLYFDVDQNLQQ